MNSGNSGFSDMISRFREFDKTIDISYHRYSSFDYCYNYFRNTDVSIDVEKSCLELGFYLASWGMLRGSGFLLQRSVRHYKNLIHYIAEQQREKKYLWDIDVNNYPENYKLLCDIYNEIKGIAIERGKTHLTIVTKIMLGVYGFVPAFDSYFIKTFNSLTKGKPSFSRFNVQSLESIYRFYLDYRSEIDKLSNEVFVLDFNTGLSGSNHYTRAKIIDMYGFQKSYDSDQLV